MIYLDNAATTEMSHSVIDVMCDVMDIYGNPGSIHVAGRDAAAVLDSSRKTAAASVYANPENIIFTSGGSEANTLAIVGSAPYLKGIGKKHIITSMIEHKSVLNACKFLAEHEGFEVSYVRPSVNGCVYTKDVEAAVREDTGLISVMAVNNELGTENNFPEIARMCDDRGIMFHTDCVQAYMRIPISARFRGVNLISVSAHKIHGPKGAGFLYAEYPERISPVIFGGTQENGLRGGTENVTAIAGFAEAIGLCMDNEQDAVNRYQRGLITCLTDGIMENISGSVVNVPPRQDSNIVNIRFDGVDAETLVLLMGEKGLCASAGSACNAHTSDPSHVLKAIGLTDDEARSSVRFSVGSWNTVGEIESAVHIIKECVEALRGNG